MKSLPAQALRLFDGYSPEDLLLPQHRTFLLERLLEEGDLKDLRWLTSQVGEPEIRAFYHQHAARRLSARSRAFWRLVLGAAEAPEASDAPSRSELWPLA